MDKELKLLIARRGGLKHRLTNFTNFLKTIKNKYDNNSEIEIMQINELNTRYENIQNLQTEFEEVQLQIDVLSPEDNPDFQERDDFINKFSECTSIAKCIINNLLKNECSELSQMPTTSLSTIKLPTIHLPSFKGDYNSWLGFKDTFTSLIHNNASIDNIQKFHYLRSSLEGDAIKIIQSLEISANNYAIAWDLICNRFNNKKLLTNNHLKALFNMENIIKDSSASLRNMIDTVYTNLRSLKTLDQPTDQWDTLIIYLITSKFDNATNKEWEQYKTSNDFPTLEEMNKFLRTRAEFLESIESKNNQKASKYQSKNTFRQTSLVTTKASTCKICSQHHALFQCETFLKLSIPQRIAKIKELHHCLNCLRPGHLSPDCNSRYCSKCNKPHNTLLHQQSYRNNNMSNSNTNNNNYSNSSTNNNNNTSSNTTQEIVADATPQISLSNINQQTIKQQVLLSTIHLYIQDSTGTKHKCKALLDSGSQSNFISSEACNKFKLKRFNTNISIIGINSISAKINQKCIVPIQSIHNKYKTTITCYVVPKITDDLPSSTINIDSWNIPENIVLADPQFNERSEIDLLIGAELFWRILEDRRIPLGRNLPSLHSTKFGWIVTGSIHNEQTTSYCNFLHVQNQEPHQDLQKFWELEEIENINNDIITEDDKLCEDHFIQNTSRNSEGRFVVRIPLKYPISNLGESKTMATKRLISLERKFQQNSLFKIQYTDFMEEYKRLQHMTKLDYLEKDKTYYFLPHHGVLRESSLTTKLRVVFDGSASSDSGWSLNNLQFKGPTIHNDIVNILLRFREYSIVIAADMIKMYRQILVHEEDRPLQCILWRSDPTEPISMYLLNTVTYGTRAAPYLAVRCIKRLAEIYQEQYRNAAEIIRRDIYVDDLITGFRSAEEAVQTCQEINNILQSAGFKLRKWTSNESNILKALHDKDEPISTLSLGDNEHTKTLGIQWSPKQDILTYHIEALPECYPITKRNILSDVAKIYDPLGLVSPCIIISKIIIQKLWTLKLDWDESVPQDLHDTWTSFRDNLSLLNTMQIRRQAVIKDAIDVELHGFCDASKHAYGAVIYTRSIDAFQNIQINLLCSKTKVAPLKTQTTPRLELCSALLLAKLMNKVTQALTMQTKKYYWSDSQIVLCWIQTQPNLLQTFVGNRIKEIQSLTNINAWRYVNTTQNPADIASRGAKPENLIKSKIWWNGPEWLNQKPEEWPNIMPLASANKIPELKSKVILTLSTKESQSTNKIKNEESIMYRFSNLTKLKRVVAYCRRFIYNSKSKTNRLSGELTIQEMEDALLCLIKLAQLESFPEEVDILRKDKSFKTKHKLQALTPFLDNQEIIRVGGRLKNSHLKFGSKHPILLSGKHQLSRLIFQYEHKQLLHAGPQLLLASVRQKYWITSGIRTAKATVKNCIKCYRFNPKPTYPIMADLPEKRVTVMNPFHVTGIDYAGPFLLKDRKGRGSKNIKGYVCVFICFTVKAIHLELVTDLSSETFISALRRFCARRGKPSHIYSDNGTNFVGAQRELTELFKENEKNISLYCSSENITWHFIPPNSPHFGGLWESAVKSVKHHLLRSLNQSHLTYEEFQTILIQVEGIVNSRPLYPMSSDPNDLEPLTPSHFLIGKSLITLPDPNLLDIKSSKLSRFQLLQQICQSYWRRWSTEYLSTLQQRHKWSKNNPNNIKVGTMVIIKQDNLPSYNWLLGRVISVHPGDDGVVRVVTVKTPRGTLKRSITKICPLPIEEQSDSESDKKGHYSD